MSFPVERLGSEDFPLQLREIPDPPQSLYYRGELPPTGMPCLAVVGSRDYTDYGKRVTEMLIGGLRGYPIAIISGLALGIDAIAHESALDAGLYTLAVPGSGLNDEVLYPRRNLSLARRILESGGGLLSEFEPTFTATAWSFPQRNRIMAGLASAVLVIEATQKSGTLITARLAVDYNRELLVVPGNIFTSSAEGPHLFLKLGATPVTSPEDILEALHIEKETMTTSTYTSALDPNEMHVIEALTEPKNRDELIRLLGTDATSANILLMHMELKNLIIERNGLIYKTVGLA